MFKNQSRLIQGNTPFETFPKGDGTAVAIGQALVLSGGLLAPATGTTAPEFISHTTSPAGERNEKIPVERITEVDEYETELTVNGGSLNPGDRVTLSANGLGVTAATAGGVFKLTTPGGVAGTKVRGMFRR